MTVYAIDFGTSNSLLAAAHDGQLVDPIALDPFAADPSIFRTLLFFPSQTKCFYGTQAINEFVAQDMQGRLIRSVKKFLPMRSFVGTFIENRPMNLEDIIGLFLKEMRSRANAHFGEDVESAVIGRPARFSTDDADDRHAENRLRRAANIAGFKHVEFLPEPVAAAREFKHTVRDEKLVLVADYGGGTSDYTVIKVGPGEYRDSDVLAIGGIPLAGDSLDGCLMRHRIAPHFGSRVEYKMPFGSNVLTMPVHLMEKICSPADISVLRKRDTMEFFRTVQQWALGKEDQKRMEQLFSLIDDQLGFHVFEELERTKKALSNAPDYDFKFEYPGISIHENVTRPQFDDYIHDRVESIIGELDHTVQKAGLRADQIDLVCCTGGTAKVPAIREALVERFGEQRIQGHNHFHSVVQGLAERARDLA